MVPDKAEGVICALDPATYPRYALRQSTICMKLLPGSLATVGTPDACDAMNVRPVRPLHRTPTNCLPISAPLPIKMQLVR